MYVAKTATARCHCCIPAAVTSHGTATSYLTTILSSPSPAHQHAHCSITSPQAARQVANTCCLHEREITLANQAVNAWAHLDLVSAVNVDHDACPPKCRASSSSAHGVIPPGSMQPAPGKASSDQGSCIFIAHPPPAGYAFMHVRPHMACVATARCINCPVSQHPGVLVLVCPVAALGVQLLPWPTHPTLCW